MAFYTQYSQAWLEDQESIKIILVVATYYDVLTLTEKTQYLSNGSYTTTDNITFSPLVRGTISLSETLNRDGSGAMTFGDLEVDNSNGDFDVWLDTTKYVWSNRSIKIYYADPRWAIATIAALDTQCLKVFDGVIDDVDSRNRKTVNLKLRDKLERLNAPVTEDKLGTYGTWNGGQQNKDAIKPVVFGEIFNTTPLLLDPAYLKYMFNNGTSEQLIEIRDNGMYLPTPNEVGGATLNIAVTNGIITGTPSVSSPGSGYVKDDVVYVEESRTINKTLTSKAKFTANFSGTTMTVTSVLSGTISNGMVISGAGIATGTTIGGVTVNGTTGSYPISIGASGTAVSVEGINGVATFKVATVTGSGIATLVPLTAGSGYTAGVKQTGVFKIDPTRKVNVVDSSIGVFFLANQPTGTITCSVQGIKNGINTSTGALTSTYANNIAQLIGLIVTQYGKENTRFTTSDLDTSNLTTFSSDKPQSVGAYVSDNTNVLAVCKNLAASVGASLFITRAGLLRLLKYGTGFTGSSVTTVTEADILYNTLVVSNRPALIGCVKLAYAKNYTVQKGLLTSIAPAHKDTMEEEWLTATVVNPGKIATYKLSQDVAPETTNLISTSDATTEAQRRLNYYSTQKIMYKFTGTSKLLGLELGQNVTLIHSRFNLYNSGLGYTAQVVSLAPNWSTGKVEVEVII